MVMEDGSVTHFKLGSLFIIFQRTARVLRNLSNKAGIITEVMHLYSTGCLICDWRIRDNE